jgi:hypothetical protein
MQVLREANPDSDILSFLSCGILFRIYLEYSDCPSIGKSSVQHSDPRVYLGAAASAWSTCGRCESRWTGGRRGWTTIPRRSCADSSASFRSGSGPSTITPGIVFSLGTYLERRQGLARAPNWPLHSCTGRLDDNPSQELRRQFGELQKRFRALNPITPGSSASIPTETAGVS